VETKEGEGAPSKTIISLLRTEQRTGWAKRGVRPAVVLVGVPGHSGGRELGETERGRGGSSPFLTLG
jgi:hypothetical protein